VVTNDAGKGTTRTAKTRTASDSVGSINSRLFSYTACKQKDQKTFKKNPFNSGDVIRWFRVTFVSICKRYFNSRVCFFCSLRRLKTTPLLLHFVASNGCVYTSQVFAIARRARFLF